MDSHGLMVQGFCREKIYSEHDKHIVRAEEVHMYAGALHPAIHCQPQSYVSLPCILARPLS